MAYNDKNKNTRKPTGAGKKPPSFSDERSPHRDSRGNPAYPPEVHFAQRPGRTAGNEPGVRNASRPVKKGSADMRAPGARSPARGSSFRTGSETASHTIRKKTQSKKRISRLYLFVAVIIVITVIVLALTVFFKVSEIEVRGNFRYRAEDIIRYSGISVGDNLLLMDKHVSAQSIKKNMLYISEIEIRRSFPDKIIINVTEINVAAAFNANGGYYWLCDDRGTLLELSDVLPEKTVIVDGTMLADSAAGKTFVTADSQKQQPLEELFSALKENGLFGLVVSIDISKIYDIKMNYMDRYKVTLGKSGDFSDSCRKLVMLIAQLEDEGSMSGTIYFSGDGIHFIAKEQ